MKSIIHLVIIFILSTVVHWALAGAGAELGLNINFMLIISVVVCSMYGKWSGYTFSFFSGIFLDFFGVAMFGAFAMTFILCAAVVYKLRNSLDFESAPPQMVLVFCLSLFSVIVYNFTGIIFLKGTSWHGFQSLILSAFINALIAPFVFGLFRTLDLPAQENSFIK